MPTLPDPNQLGGNSPRPSTQIVNVNAGQVEGARAARFGAQGRDAMEVGSAVARFGNNIAALAMDEKKRIDSFRRVEFSTKLRDKSTELLVGANGALTKKEGQVLEKDYLKTYAEQYDAQAKELKNGLGNDEQKAAFDQDANELKSQYLRSILTHTLTETEKHADTTDKALMASYLNSAQALNNDPAAVDRSAVGAEAAVVARMTRIGADPVTMQQAVLESKGAVYAAAIDAARQAGNVAYANKLFAANYSEDSTDPTTGVMIGGVKNMTEDQAQAVQAKLKPDTEWQQGTALAEQMQDMTEADAGKFLREQVKSQGFTKEVEQNARAQFRQIKQEQEQAQKDTVGSMFLSARDAGWTSAAVNALRTSEEFKNLPDAIKDDVIEHADMRRRQAENDVETDSDKANKKKWEGGDAYRTFATLSQMLDENPNSISEEALRYYDMAIGPRAVASLETERQRLLSGAAKFKFDPFLMRDAVPKELEGAKKKSQRDAFMGIIQANLLDWKVANPGKIPDERTQARILRSANETYQAPGRLWGTNEKPLYSAPENEQNYRRKELQAREDATLRGATFDKAKFDIWFAKNYGTK